MEIVIKRKITLEFLGEDYKDAYLVFKAIPVNEYTNIQNELKKAEADNTNGLETLQNLLGSYFVSGEFPNPDGELEKVTKEDIGKFDAEVLFVVLDTIKGNLTPKAQTP